MSATPANWTDICALDDIVPDTAAGAMHAGRQIAVVRLGAEQVFAIANFDPFSRAMVLARGIVGDSKGTPKISSPVYKQGFDLRTGACLDDPTVRVPTWPARISGGRVEVAG